MPDHAFIFMPHAHESEAPFRFKWGKTQCSFNARTRELTAEEPAVENDPSLHSWLRMIFG